MLDLALLDFLFTSKVQVLEMTQPAIETRALTRKFGNTVAVRDLSLRVRRGEVFALLGPNGAGKTTTVRMLSCLIRPSAGTALVAGNDIIQDALKIREVVGLLPENPGLYPELSAYYTLDFYAKLYGVPASERKRRIRDLLELLGIWERRNEPVGRFSRGMQQKVAIARALVHDPEVLFLDEPTASLAPESAKVVREFIRKLRRKGRTILLCTHNLHEAEQLCDRVAILKTSLLTVGSPTELEREFGTQRVEIQLKRITARILQAVRRIGGVRKVKRGKRTLTVEVDDSSEVNPRIASAIVKAGGKIVWMKQASSLEEAYLKVVEST